MDILHIIVILVVVGLILWLVNTYIPMAEPIKKILNVVVIILVVLWLLSAIGLFAGDLGTFGTHPCRPLP